MTRRDFELIAKAIRTSPLIRSFDEHAPEIRRELAAEFATMLAATNTNFRRAQFLVACDPEE